jgi:beta-ketoacyl synthase-like protein
MFYIHQTKCISPQHTFNDVNLDDIQLSKDNVLSALEPDYEGIPPAMFRRMGKAVRLASGAALPLLNTVKFNGIVIGTAFGGLEDCIKFLNQITEYNEGRLTPTNFVQSTTNAIASQLAFFSANKGYNNTHVHRGLAFENAMLDVAMQLNENPAHTYLLGGVEEISAYQYNIESLAGSYKKELVSNTDLYNSITSGSIAGEGCAMFVLNRQKENAVANVKALSTLHTENKEEIAAHLQQFISKNTANAPIDLFITGENGDIRYLPYYKACEEILPNIPTIHFKHLSGEYPTACSFALWLACHKIKTTKLTNILIYNNYQGKQHSFMLVGAI